MNYDKEKKALYIIKLFLNLDFDIHLIGWLIVRTTPQDRTLGLLESQ